jgi:hypothetical protein
MKINENIALAKSILRKNNIEIDSDEYKDYLKIRDIVDKEYSYIGILTRLRFVDGVSDIEELKSIYQVLKNSKLDLGKLNRMSYEDILDTFYDELTNSVNKNKDDYELIYKDDTYSFFRVYTYKGILEIGSPAWCLKTKSNWDEYQSKYPEQWVVIDNRYVKRIITPNNSYLGGKYVNKERTWVRFGISFLKNSNNTTTWIAHDDNDGTCNLTNHTFYGVLYTTLNLSSNIIKSYYQRFSGCEYIEDGVLRITDNAAWQRLNINPPSNKNDVNYLSLSKTYSFPPVVIKLKDDSVPCVHINTLDSKKLGLGSIKIGGAIVGRLLSEYTKGDTNISYIGVKLKNGTIKIEDLRLRKDFILEVGKWIVFNWNESYYISIDTNINYFKLPTMDKLGNLHWYDISDDNDSPSFYLIDRKTLQIDKLIEPTEHGEIIKQLKELESGEALDTEIKTEDKPETRVKGFWDFLKNKK